VATTTTTDTVRARSAERDRLTLGRERLIGAGVVVAAAVVLLLAAQVHHWIAPRDSDGAAGEILPVLIGGVLGWLVVFGAALIPPHRAADTAMVSRRYALGFGLFAVPMVVLAYWTPIPWCLGAASLLLLRRAGTVHARSRSDLAATVLAWVAIVAPVLIFVGVVVAALH
jgi:hypothetical protein